jgi:phage FluMu protein Com
MQMKIIRSVDGLRFVAECDESRGFTPKAIECVLCGRTLDTRVQTVTISLGCSECKTIPQIFWSEAQMHVFIAENWNALRQQRSHARTKNEQQSG